MPENVVVARFVYVYDVKTMACVPLLYLNN